MTERELLEIEARIEAELATGGWSGDGDLTYDLLRDEMPRLLAEVRRLQAQVQVYRDGISELESDTADRILDKALRAGRERRPGRNATGAEPGHGSIMEALEQELRAVVDRRDR